MPLTCTEPVLKSVIVFLCVICPETGGYHHGDAFPICKFLLTRMDYRANNSGERFIAGYSGQRPGAIPRLVNVSVANGMGNFYHCVNALTVWRFLRANDVVGNQQVVNFFLRNQSPGFRLVQRRL